MRIENGEAKLPAAQLGPKPGRFTAQAVRGSAQGAQGAATEGQAGRRRQVAGSRARLASLVGTPLDAHNVRRAFRAIVKSTGMPANYWTPREMRHSFVSLLSDSGVPLEDIARLVGHSGTAVTEAVYRQQIRPVLLQGTAAMDVLFGQ
ncbi:tyrosine-type recombinase/integrase [Actinomadura sp. ATCC 31491]|uniref:Tyrosine-type recombinase/integrase n=1 Tax=Actinomadura luzonensis TaxID=2805427 RepID=A0ABT0G0P6_9ACTN|nr:tyrosine-type recombinase/integrase [Actinomadura luzonensis]MCK2218125.1 tyrosine-type recombinase/integrase [Actinomadura luzonensis]